MSASTPREMVVLISTNDADNPTQMMGSSLDRMSLEPGAVKDEKKAEQKKTMSPMQLATQLGADVNQQAWEWTQPAIRCSINLTYFTREVTTADSIGGKLEKCGKVFEGMHKFRGKFTKDRESQQQALQFVINKLMPVNIVAAHRDIVE